MYPAPSALIHVPNVNINKHADYNMYIIYINIYMICNRLRDHILR